MFEKNSRNAGRKEGGKGGGKEGRSKGGQDLKVGK